jgi:hypothetical protein
MNTAAQGLSKPQKSTCQISPENLILHGAEQQEVLQAPRVLPIHRIALLERCSVVPCFVTLLRDLEARAFVN